MLSKLKKLNSIFTILALILLITIFFLATPVFAQDVIWSRLFGTPGSDIAFDIVVDGIGNEYVVGQTSGSLSGQSWAGGPDAFIRKYDSNGNEIWTRQFGSSARDVAQGIAKAESFVYVAGLTEGVIPGQTSVGFRDAFLRKYDFDGNEIWTRQFGTTTFEAARAVAADSAGVYVVGVTSGSFPGFTSAGQQDAFIRKYDSSGTEIWTRQFGTSLTDSLDSVTIDGVGNVYVAGSTANLGGTQPGFDGFVSKFDSNGNQIWTRFITTPSSDGATGVAVNETGVYVVGRVEDGDSLPGQTTSGGDDAYLRKYDPDGNEVWTRQFGTANDEREHGVAVEGTNIYVSGWTGQEFGDRDPSVRKYDSNGNEIWVLNFGSTGFGAALDMAIHASQIYVVGATDGILFGQSSVGGFDAFIVKISENQPPIANAGPDQTVLVNTLVALDGSGSSDPDSDPVTYAWSEDVGNPQAGVLSSTTTVNPTFTPTIAGIYTFTLVVNDGLLDSAPDTIVITVQTPSEGIQNLINIVETFNLQRGIDNSLHAKLEAAIQAITDLNENNDVAAINSLQSFINAVEAQRGNKLTDAQADELINAALAIINSLSL